VRLTYNGIEISLGPPNAAGGKTHHVGAQPVYDPTNQDLLFTRYTFDCTGYVNPFSTAYARLAGLPTPVATPGAVAATTVAAIRDALAQPHQLLTYSDNAGNVLLRSPPVNPSPIAVNPPNPNPAGAAFSCDFTGGPIILRAPEILEVSGDKTMRVRVVYQTDINESFIATTRPPVLVSNRWEIHESLDDCAFSTLTYTGTAVFRLDLLNAMQFNGRPLVPDDFRDFSSAFAIPAGFKRMSVDVRADPNGYTYRYRVVDEQRAVTLTDFTAMDVEARLVDGIDSPGLEKFGKQSWDHILDFAGNTLLKPTTWIDAIGSAFNMFRGLSDTVYNNIPQRTTRLNIVAKGHSASTRKNLALLCFAVLQQLVTKFDLLVASNSVQLTQDLMDKYVMLDVAIRRGPVATVFKFGVGLGSLSVPALSDGIPATDDIQGEVQDAPGRWPPFPGPGEVRGNALVALLTQSLYQPYTAPGKSFAVTAPGQGLAVQ
jgi:hypothetical protein